MFGRDRKKKSEASGAADPTAPATRKRFRIAAADMRDFGLANVACLATDRIVVDGEPVRFAQRDREQLGPEDSGWRFFAGDEDDAYMDTVSNHGVYALNTIANYDQIIIPILDAPPGTAWVRDGDQLIPDPEGFPEDRT